MSKPDRNSTDRIERIEWQLDQIRLNILIGSLRLTILIVTLFLAMVLFGGLVALILLARQ